MNSANSAPSRRLIVPKWTLWVVFGALLAPVFSMTRADPDLWGHVRFGLDILATRELPRVDPYSFTQDLPWVNHEWLSEVLMAAAYRAGGTPGLVILKGALVAAIFAVVLRGYANAPPVAAGLVFLLVAAGTGRVTTSMRPQLWSVLGAAILFRFLLESPRRWWLAAVPFMFVLWVNLHGGWIVGAGILVIWTFVHLWRGDFPRTLVAAVALLSAAATLLNPYGWHMWEFLGATIRLSRSISEWQPLLTTPAIFWVPWIVAVIGVALSGAFTARLPVDRLAILAGLAYASFRVERLASFFIVAAVILVRPTISVWWRPFERSFDPLPKRHALALGMCLIILTIGSAIFFARSASCIAIEGDWVPDRVAGRALVEGRPRGTIVTWFDWGEYVIWHLAPALRVSLDGRRETIYSDTVLSRHDELYRASPSGLSYLKQLNPDYVWLPAASAGVATWLEANGYRLDVHTEESFVAVRQSLPPLHVRHEPLTRCFPGP